MRNCALLNSVGCKNDQRYAREHFVTCYTSSLSQNAVLMSRRIPYAIVRFAHFYLIYNWSM